MPLFFVKHVKTISCGAGGGDSMACWLRQILPIHMAQVRFPMLLGKKVVDPRYLTE